MIEHLQIMAYLAQIFSAPLVAYTLFIYVRQARAMESHLQIQQEHIQHIQDSRAELQFYQVIQSLISMRPHIERILLLDEQPFERWTEEDHEAAIHVCGQFHFAGVLVYEKLIPEELLAKSWCFSIQQCYKILRPFIISIRQKRDQRYWSGFDFLARRVAEITIDFKGFT